MKKFKDMTTAKNPYFIGENGLEKVVHKTKNAFRRKLTSRLIDTEFQLTDEEYNKLKAFSENLSNLFKIMDEEKELRLKQFIAGVQKIQGENY